MKVRDCNSVKPLKYGKAMAQLSVSLWGYSALKLNTFPRGTPANKGSLSDATFLFHWGSENVSGDKKWNTKPEVNVYVFQYDGKFDVGHSGSPVCYSGNNNVIGVFTAKDDDNGWVIPIQTILENLENEIIVYQPSPVVDISHHIQKGNESFLKGDYVEALREYESALNDRNYFNALFNKAVTLRKLGGSYEAIHFYDRFLQIDPNSASAWLNKGEALDTLGRHIEAVQSYDTALQIDPTKAMVWNNKAKSLVNLGNYFESIQCAEKALEINPNLALAWDNKAWALGNLEKYEEAIQSIDKALEIDPKFSTAWDHKGWIFEKLGRDNEAKQYYDKARQLEEKKLL
jgi:Flp pilus assembly protein TadD